ncbi:MAG TPA: hypothetical protein VD995_30500 [Azospirillum sp.]|nr:hypothetical protein [Azospirillum sp.]
MPSQQDRRRKIDTIARHLFPERESTASADLSKALRKHVKASGTEICIPRTWDRFFKGESVRSNTEISLLNALEQYAAIHGVRFQRAWFDFPVEKLDALLKNGNGNGAASDSPPMPRPPLANTTPLEAWFAGVGKQYNGGRSTLERFSGTYRLIMRDRYGDDVVFLPLRIGGGNETTTSVEIIDFGGVIHRGFACENDDFINVIVVTAAENDGVSLWYICLEKHQMENTMVGMSCRGVGSRPAAHRVLVERAAADDESAGAPRRAAPATPEGKRYAPVVNSFEHIVGKRDNYVFNDLQWVLELLNRA